MASETRGKVTIFPSPTLVPEIWANRSISNMNDLNKRRQPNTVEIPPLPPIPGRNEISPDLRLSARHASYSSQRSAPSKYAAAALVHAIDTELANKAGRAPSEATELEYGNVTIVAPWEYQTEHRKLCTPMVSWKDDVLNPKNWPAWKRWMPVTSALLAAFLIGMASTSLASVTPVLRAQYLAGATRAALPTAMFILPLIFGPAISTTISTVYGRKLPYMLSLPLLFVFILAGSFSETLATLLFCRFFAGLAAGPALSIGYDTIMDVWTAADSLTPMSLHHGFLVLGAALGATTAGPATLSHSESYKWTQYALLIVCIVNIFIATATKDTSAIHILKRDRHWNMGTSLTKDVLLQCTTRPLGILFADPTLLAVSLYSGLVLATVLIAFMSWPMAYLLAYAQDLNLTTVLAAFILGTVFSMAASCIYIRIFHQRWVANLMNARAARAEQRLTSRDEKRRSRLTPPCSPSESHFDHLSRRPVSALSPLQHDFYQQPAIHRKSSVLTTFGSLEQERNVHLAVVATRYLNSIPQNNFISSSGTSKRMMPERMVRLLNSDPTFGDFCSTLESVPYEQRFDRVQLAKLLVECLEACPKTPISFHDSIVPTPTSVRPSFVSRPPLALSRSKSMHRNAAAAALSQFSQLSLSSTLPVPRSPSPPLEALPPIQRSLPAFPYEAPQDYRSPPEWTLYPALPATLILPLSVFLFAWTDRPEAGVHWFVPVFAIFLFGLSTTLVFISAGCFIILHAVATRISGRLDGLNNDEQEDIKQAKSMLNGAFVLRWLLCFLFVMVVGRMFEMLGSAWASTVFGIIMVVFGIVPWVLIWTGKRWRQRRRRIGSLHLVR